MERDRHTLKEHLPDRPVERWTGLTLRIGVWCSAGFMAAGLLLASRTPSGETGDAFPRSPEGVLSLLTSGGGIPVSMMYAGVLLLMLTPFVRVLAAMLGFLIEKDTKFVTVSLLVFTMLAGELVFTFR